VGNIRFIRSWQKEELKILLVFLMFFLCGRVFSEEKQPKLVKFIASNTTEGGKVQTLPLFLAMPDSICRISSERFMFATDDEAKGMLEKSHQKCFEAAPWNLQFLVVLRDMYSGKVEKTVKGFLALRKQKLQPLLSYCMKVNQAVYQCTFGEFKIAEKKLKSILKKHKWKDACWKNLFSIYMGEGRYQKADELVEKVMKDYPKTIWAQQYKINLIQMFGTRADLVSYLESKSSWHDSLFAMQTAYGRLLKENGYIDKAIEYYTRGLEGNPKDGEAWLELAEIYHMQDKNILVMQCLGAAIHAGISNPLYFQLLASIIREKIFFNFIRLKTNEVKLQECKDILRKLQLKKLDVGLCPLTAQPLKCYEYFKKLSDVIEMNFASCEEYYRHVESQVTQNFTGMQMMLESVFIQGTYSRALAHTLYYCYGALGKNEHIHNLSSQLWFHFDGPFPVAGKFAGHYFVDPVLPELKVNFSPVTFPLYLRLLRNDFFEGPDI
jgi:tetratricopeptide (TPR) repeat protein